MMNEPTVAPEPSTQREPEIKLEVETKHIVICEVILAWKPLKKTKRYIVYNKKSYDILAEIHWNGPWRQYCLFPEPQCTWSTSCLDTVVTFIKKINDQRREHPRDNSGGETAKIKTVPIYNGSSPIDAENYEN